MPRHSCQTSTADTRRSYTIGLYETVQQPELIVVGMKQDSAHYLLNEAARRMEQGLRLAGGRGEKNFLKISHVNSRKLMEYALWFYGEDEFPVFQCVYADLNVPFLGTMVSGRHPFRR